MRGDGSYAAARRAMDPLAAAGFGPFKIFRMNRDIRFSPDKSPYKTQHGAAHEADGTVYYVHLDASGLMAACGAYMMAPDQLERYREAVADDNTGPALQGILNDLSERGFEVGHGMRRR